MLLDRKRIEQRITGLMDRLSNNTTLMAIRNGLLLTLPLVMAGSIALLLNNLPIPAYQEAMTEIFGPYWKVLGTNIWRATFGILALLMLYSISHHLVNQFNLSHPIQPVSSTIAALLSLACLVIIMPLDDNVDILLDWTGSKGLFVAIVVSLVATKLFLRLSQVKWLQISLHAEGADTAIPQSFSALFPGIITLFAFGLFKTGLFIAGVSDIHYFIHYLILYPFTLFQDSLEGGTVYILLSHVLWFFGIHGPNVLDPITHDYYTLAMDQNLAAVAAGLPIPHVVSKIFLDTFVFMGGAGSSVCLLLAIFMTSQNNSNRRLAQFSLLPGIFNINEMLLFGLPVILNPIFFIPFVFVPLLLSFISYSAFYLGCVPNPIHQVVWTTPPLVSGYVATGSIAGTLLQCFNLAIGTLCYIPFIRFSDRVKNRRFEVAMKGLMAVALSNRVGPSGKKCLDRDDEIGVLARALANDLRIAMKKNEELFLEYQPQINYRTGCVVGAEALIRWKHVGYGLIPPPITIAIAEDGDFINELGLWVTDAACAERKRWLDRGIEEVRMSINLSVRQLEDPLLPQKILRIIHQHKLTPDLVEIEVTESVALNYDSQDNVILNRIHELGIHIAIDDFGMGHSSLLYLKHFPVDTLKLDQTLSKDVANSKACFEIITTIVDLCKAMEVDIVAEFIEDEAQIEILTRLGCYIFQGYYFSRPRTGPDSLDYIKMRNRLTDQS